MNHYPTERCTEHFVRYHPYCVHDADECIRQTTYDLSAGPSL